MSTIITPSIMDKKTEATKPQPTLVEEYVKTWSEKEQKGYHIAKTHLQTSFQIEKSNGFIQWKKTITTNN